ncbi:MAG: type II secretion system protein GspE, partial [Nitrospinota bacterium]
MGFKKKKKLGGLLVDAGALTSEQLQKALKYQQKTGSKLGRTVVEQKLISEKALITALAEQLNIDIVDLDSAEPDPELIRRFPESAARRHVLIPLRRNGQRVTVVMADPLNIFAID